MFELNGQHALVTGGARGIGKGIAGVLARAGATVVIGDIDESVGEATAAELGAHVRRLDVTSATDCRDTVNGIVEEFGSLEILASNTGIYPQTTLAEMTDDDWYRVLDVNLKGAYLTAQAAARHMASQRYGRIVITSSITGPITGYPGWTHYGASKAGLLGFMRSAALEYATQGVTVNAVMPGNVLTEGLAAQGEAYLAEMRAAIPMHALGAPEDIGHAVAFLASREAGYITGQTLVIDGGQVLPESPDAIPAPE